jgi:N-acetylglucosaminyldiphosphoundecaprenol N-acetyl-beta-D-mannosaminyltransferase
MSRVEPTGQVTEIAGIPYQDIGFEETVRSIIDWARRGERRYVCTPNVDYVVRSHREPRFRDAIIRADLRVPDGMWVIYGSRLAGRPLRSSVTGRLLPQAVVKQMADDQLPIALFGGPPGVADRAAQRLAAAGADVVAAFGPGMGFVVGSTEDTDAVARLRDSGARIVFVGLGAPKQEEWMLRHRDELDAVLVGIGAGLDVLAGRVREAPRWMTRVGAEWLFRLAQEPRRLARRYLLDDPRFLWWMLRERMRPTAQRDGQ